jgi:hypothetical protein
MLLGMTIYESLRVILSVVQIIVTIGAPFMVLWLDRKIRNDRRD